MKQENEIKIAIIDDEEMVTESIKNLLEFETVYKILTYNDPNKALEELKETDINMVICDFFMKNLNGLELLKELRKYHNETPFVMLTGYADKENTIKAINELSLYYYLEKPWDNDELLLVIKNGIEKGNLISELKSKMKELEQAYRRLEETQDELIKEEKMSTIGKMASKVIHDLKNPMTSISGFAELIIRVSEEKKTSDDPEERKTFEEIKDFAQIIMDEVHRLVGMITEINHYAKGSELYHKNILPLRDVVMDTVNVLRKNFKKENIKIEVKTTDKPLKMGIDHDKIIRMLYNILYNSKEAMKKGGTIKIIMDKPNDKLIQLSIIDDGSGMPEEVKKRVFEPFVTYGKSNGTGLGMAIVKKIVEAHNGTIKVDSEEGEGTRFDIYFRTNGEDNSPD